MSEQRIETSDHPPCESDAERIARGRRELAELLAELVVRRLRRSEFRPSREAVRPGEG